VSKPERHLQGFPGIDWNAEHRHEVIALALGMQRLTGGVAPTHH
jgi:hypothetical protein